MKISGVEQSLRDVRLEQLRYRNFKGAEAREWDFQGRNAVILGGNGTGKTTVFDAFTWLLFGKDSAGRTDFDLKPHGADGAVLDHGAVTEVEAALSVNGERLTLKRTYFEKWTRKRGSAETEMDGHGSEFFVDGVPVLKKDFDAEVRSLADEELFPALTDVYAFAGRMDWKRRRALLLNLCALPPDAILMRQDPEGRFGELADALGRMDPESYKKSLLSRRKSLQSAQTSVPARLDEQKRNVEALAGTDFPALKEERQRKTEEAGTLQKQLLQLDHGALSEAKRNELKAKRNELDALETRNREHRLTQERDGGSHADRSAELTAAMNRAADVCAEIADRVQRCLDAIDTREARLTELRNAWCEAADKLDALPRPGAGVVIPESLDFCPTCGQPLPADQVQAARDRFVLQWSEDIRQEGAKYLRQQNRIESEAQRENEALAAERERRDKLVEQKRKADRAAEAARKALESYVPPEPPRVEDLPEYGERRTALEAEIAALRQEIAGLDANTAGVRRGIQERLDALHKELGGLDRQIALEEQLEFSRRRCEELQAEARKVTEELEELDRMLALCEAYTRWKVSFIEDTVNSLFRRVRFRLFTVQVNGGLADCCEATVDGTRFDNGLNTGAKCAAGLEIIGALSEGFGLRLPVFVDGTESVERLPETGCQVIRLEVDKVHRELRCEYEN